MNLVEQIEEQQKALEQVENSISIFEKTFEDLKNNAKKEDRKKLDLLELDMKKLISSAKKGGDITNYITALKKQYGTNDNK